MTNRMEYNKTLRLGDDEIKNIYDVLKSYFDKFLEEHGVKLPSLQVNGSYTKNALTLVLLAREYPNNSIISKEELTAFIREYMDTNDVQQARHLAAQSGWYIASGQRGDLAAEKQGLKKGEYKLVTLEKPYPGFTHERRDAYLSEDSWEDLKKEYDYRCATCGSKEGEPSYRWPEVITKLQKAHMNPDKSLVIGNTIPQCQECNRADRNKWVYDKKGRVIRPAKCKVK